MSLQVIGKPEAGAVRSIKEAGLRSRVTKRDGTALVATRDHRTDRVNLEIVNGVVVAASIG
jgi:hypothetical protein